MTGSALRNCRGGRGRPQRLMLALALLASLILLGDCAGSASKPDRQASAPNSAAPTAPAQVTHVAGARGLSAPTQQPAAAGTTATSTAAAGGGAAPAVSSGSAAASVPASPTHSSEPSPGCPLDGQPLSQVGMTLPGCQLVASDTASNPNPVPFWGFIACQNDSRVQQLTSGGDPHLTATGDSQGNADYRRMTVLDGDNPFGWGERCELGKNDHRTGPTVFYHEGEQRVTYLSIRLPENFNRNVNTWQDVMQMKETEPYDNQSHCCPILYFGVHNGAWRVESVYGEYATFPARNDVWTRFAFDVFYSRDASKGWLQVSADLNGDGDFNDPGERSPVIHAQTLLEETNGPHGSSDGIAAGESIPSHLRVGIYHNPSIPCPAPSGCSTEVDNVQVMKSPSGP